MLLGVGLLSVFGSGLVGIRGADPPAGVWGSSRSVIGACLAPVNEAIRGDQVFGGAGLSAAAPSNCLRSAASKNAVAR
jgi:hypothetical protein